MKTLVQARMDKCDSLQAIRMLAEAKTNKKLRELVQLFTLPSVSKRRNHV
jgi:hypothetical protein